MNPWERRQKLLETLCLRRQSTYKALAYEFQVSPRTIQHDIIALTCSYPIETVQGSQGGVRIAEWYRLDRKTLNAGEIEFLRKIESRLDECDREKLSRIIVQFSH